MLPHVASPPLLLILFETGSNGFCIVLVGLVFILFQNHSFSMPMGAIQCNSMQFSNLCLHALCVLFFLHGTSKHELHQLSGALHCLLYFCGLALENQRFDFYRQFQKLLAILICFLYTEMIKHRWKWQEFKTRTYIIILYDPYYDPFRIL